MSKIVIDAREYTTTTGRYVFRLLEYLARTKSEHEYVVLLKPSDFDAAHFDNPQFTKIKCDVKEFTFAEQITLMRQIKSLQPDLVHFPMVQQPILYQGRVVTTMQDLTTIRFRNPSKNAVVFTAKQQVYKLINHIAARKSKLLITPTEFVKQDVVSYTHVSPDKITVTLEAADRIPDAPEPVPGLMAEGGSGGSAGSTAKFIMYLGRPLPHKNLGRLIQAFAELKQKYPDLKLVLAGKKDALYEMHERDAAEQGMQNIIFTGFVSEGQLRWLYENCQAYVFPSLSEGFGLPGLEAMIHGAPVASSNATCLPEVYDDAAHYFDPLSVEDIARAISDILDNDTLRQELIDKGAIQAAHYSWARMAEQTLDVYNRALRTD
jgi:glycosyltransferase involved in cell wall biosynthesis